MSQNLYFISALKICFKALFVLCQYCFNLLQFIFWNVAGGSSLALTLSLLLISAYTPSLLAQRLVEIQADQNYFPYIFEEDGEAKGIYAEIMVELDKLIDDYRIQLVMMPWKRALINVENGSAFAVLPPYKNTKDRPYIWPYSNPILKETVVLYCRNRIFTHQIEWPNSFLGQRVGRNVSFRLGGSQYYDLTKDNKIFDIETKGTRNGLLMLIDDRIDCYMNGRLAIIAELKSLIDKNQYVTGIHSELNEIIEISSSDGHIGYSNTNNSDYEFKDDFIIKLDTALARLKKSGFIEQTVQRYSQLTSVGRIVEKNEIDKQP